LGAAASEAAQSLVEALKTQTADARTVLEALGKLGPAAESATPHVLKLMLTGEPESIREVAAHTLTQICPDGQIAADSATGWEPEGIERMGDKAILLKEELRQFRQIGEDCKARKADTFVFGKLAEQIGETDKTLANHMKSISKFFREYFLKYEGYAIPPDEDGTAAPKDKLFDRTQGRKPTICRLGWQAWELTCHFLERQEEREAARRQANLQID
jgi:hypothetical protein